MKQLYGKHFNAGVDNQINWLNSSLRLYVTKSIFYEMQAYCGKDYNVIPTGMIGKSKKILVTLIGKDK